MAKIWQQYGKNMAKHASYLQMPMLLTAVDANAATAIDGKLVQISRICRCGCTVATGQCGSSPTGGFALHSCCAFSKQVPCMIL